MENEFDDVMRKRTDAELIKIVNGPADDYQPAALEAAKREFARRNLSQAQIAVVKQQIKQEQAIAEIEAEKRAEEPLGIYSKIFAFIFPRPGRLISARIYKSQGYHTQAKELQRWTLYGFGFYVLVIIIIVLSK